MKLFAIHSSMNFGRKRTIFSVIFSLTLLFMIITIAVNINASINFIASKACYQHKEIDGSELNRSIALLDDILFSERQPRPGKSIFFHETSCSADNLVRLNARCVSECVRDNCQCIFVLIESSFSYADRHVPLSLQPNGIRTSMYSSYSLRQLVS